MKKMKNAFTLIELLAVIIILAIIALIAVPIILDVIEDARISAGKSEAQMILSGINNYCATEDVKYQLDNSYTKICTSEMNKDDVPTMVNLGNATIESIKYNGSKLTELVIESNNHTFMLCPSGTFAIDTVCDDTEQNIEKNQIYSYNKIDNLYFNTEIDFDDSVFKEFKYDERGVYELASLGDNYGLAAINLSVFTGSIDGYVVAYGDINFTDTEIIYSTTNFDLSSIYPSVKVDVPGWQTEKIDLEEDTEIVFLSTRFIAIKNDLVYSTSPVITQIDDNAGKTFYYNPYTQSLCDAEDLENNCYEMSVVSTTDTTIDAIVTRNIVENVKPDNVNNVLQQLQGMSSYPVRLPSINDLKISGAYLFEIVVEEELKETPSFFESIGDINYNNTFVLSESNKTCIEERCINVPNFIENLSDLDNGIPIAEYPDFGYWLNNGSALYNDFFAHTSEYLDDKPVGIRPIVTLPKTLIRLQ